MTLRLGNAITDALASQFGGLQDPCTAGGMFCPQPQSAGAGLNPCCWSSAASTNAKIDPETGKAEPLAPLGLPTGIPTWVWVGLAAFAAYKIGGH